MAKCKIEYREPVFILELSASEKVALVECLKARLSEKHGSTIALRDLTNINTALREATDG